MLGTVFPTTIIAILIATPRMAMTILLPVVAMFMGATSELPIRGHVLEEGSELDITR
jgi:hypothetical protein